MDLQTALTPTLLAAAQVTKSALEQWRTESAVVADTIRLVDEGEFSCGGRIVLDLERKSPPSSNGDIAPLPVNGSEEPVPGAGVEVHLENGDVPKLFGVGIRVVFDAVTASPGSNTETPTIACNFGSLDNVGYNYVLAKEVDHLLRQEQQQPTNNSALHRLRLEEEVARRMLQDSSEAAWLVEDGIEDYCRQYIHHSYRNRSVPIRFGTMSQLHPINVDRNVHTWGDLMRFISKEHEIPVKQLLLMYNDHGGRRRALQKHNTIDEIPERDFDEYGFVVSVQVLMSINPWNSPFQRWQSTTINVRKAVKALASIFFGLPLPEASPSTESKFMMMKSPAGYTMAEVSDAHSRKVPLKQKPLWSQPPFAAFTWCAYFTEGDDNENGGSGASFGYEDFHYLLRCCCPSRAVHWSPRNHHEWPLPFRAAVCYVSRIAWGGQSFIPVEVAEEIIGFL